MKNRFLLIAAGALLFSSLGGCGGDSAELEFDVPVAPLAEGNFSGVGSQRFEIIIDPERFADVWLEHAGALSPIPAAPQVDFARQTVLAAFLGTRGTSGHGIEMTGALERDTNITVNLRITVPGPTCPVLDAQTQPFQMTTIARTEKVVAFVPTVEAVDCPLAPMR